MAIASEGVVPIRPIITSARLIASIIVIAAAAELAAAPLETVVVTGRRVETTTTESTVAITRIESIAETAPLHANELAWQAPGTWISRGSGQEQLTAIRSPVLTGPGSCGSFLFLEDGVPIRPVGFCNVNQLFEVNTEQAHAFEVARGPLGAVWGANALHGAINVINDFPRSESIRLTAGADNYWGVSGVFRPVEQGLALFNLSRDGGFRPPSGYDQGKLNLFVGTPGVARLGLAMTALQQETAGFVQGADAYRDPVLRTANPNPEAFRDAQAQRATFRHQLGAWQLTHFARHSRMTFLQHFLPGKPLERNSQHSLGTQLSRSLNGSGWSAVLGLDVEWSRGSLAQTQSGPASGSAFIVATRPPGQHYRYDVDSAHGGAWLSALYPIDTHTFFEVAARAGVTRYHYDNQLSDGNLRDDGTACGFGGCLYNRPADRNDTFGGTAARLALLHRLSNQWRWHVSLAQGFRPPQTTELYRLQRGQDSAELDNETTLNYETGLVWVRPRLSAAISAYAMRKDAVVLRDADGFTINDGRTLHEGLEVQLLWQPVPRWQVDLAATRALHRYDFDRDAALGEIIRRGARIDSAPKHIGSLRLKWQPQTHHRLAFEWLHLGAYFTNAANSHRYPGHDLVNLRYHYRLQNWELGIRVSNLADTRYAERADFAFGNPRYFPGRDRALYLTLGWVGKQKSGP